MNGEQNEQIIRKQSVIFLQFGTKYTKYKIESDSLKVLNDWIISGIKKLMEAGIIDFKNTLTKATINTLIKTVIDFAIINAKISENSSVTVENMEEATILVDGVWPEVPEFLKKLFRKLKGNLSESSQSDLEEDPKARSDTELKKLKGFYLNGKK